MNARQNKNVVNLERIEQNIGVTRTKQQTKQIIENEYVVLNNFRLSSLSLVLIETKMNSRIKFCFVIALNRMRFCKEMEINQARYVVMILTETISQNDVLHRLRLKVFDKDGLQ